jgi:hypothetical protein
MAKEDRQAEAFLSRFKQQIEGTAQKSRSHDGPINAFRSVFAIQELEPSRANDLTLLLQISAPESKNSRDIERDCELLKNITIEILAIQKQSVLLLGERITKAKALLRAYGDGTTPFTKWLDATFSSRRTAYNCIAYYELYTTLPNEILRERLKLMSHKAAYMLAARKGEITQKCKIIEDYYLLKQHEIIPIIASRFPPSRHSRGQEELRPTQDKGLTRQPHRNRGLEAHASSTSSLDIDDYAISAESVLDLLQQSLKRVRKDHEEIQKQYPNRAREIRSLLEELLLIFKEQGTETI